MVTTNMYDIYPQVQIQWHHFRHPVHRHHARHSETATLRWASRIMDAVHGLQEPPQRVASIQHGAPIEGGRKMRRACENCKVTRPIPWHCFGLWPKFSNKTIHFGIKCKKYKFTQKFNVNKWQESPSNKLYLWLKMEKLMNFYFYFLRCTFMYINFFIMVDSIVLLDFIFLISLML